MNDITNAASNVVSGTSRIGTGWGIATMIFGALAIMAPFITGVAGLMLGLDRELTSAQIAGILRRSAKPLPSSDYAWKNDAGFGVVDVDLCLREADNINKRRDQTG